MGAIRYTMRDGRFVLADGCCVTGTDGVEELDCSVRLYKLLKRNGFDQIEQVTAKPGMTFFEIEGMGLKAMKELLEHLDFLGFRLADWRREDTVDNYFSFYIAEDKRRLAAEMAQIEAEIQAERRERARLRARENRQKKKMAAISPENKGVMTQ